MKKDRRGFLKTLGLGALGAATMAIPGEKVWGRSMISVPMDIKGQADIWDKLELMEISAVPKAVEMGTPEGPDWMKKYLADPPILGGYLVPQPFAQALLKNIKAVDEMKAKALMLGFPESAIIDVEKRSISVMDSRLEAVMKLVDNYREGLVEAEKRLMAMSLGEPVEGYQNRHEFNVSVGYRPFAFIDEVTA